MSSERITALYYKLDLGPETAYADGASRSVSLDGFTGTLARDRCTFTPTEHFESVEDARSRLEPQLRAWQKWVVLTTAQDWLPFRFDSADREPWPPPAAGTHVILVDSACMAMTSDEVILRLTRGEFPEPPPPFAVDECVEIGLALLEDANRLPRHVLKFADAFRSLLDSEHGGNSDGRRAAAARALNVAEQVLRDLSELCANGGTGAEARAFKPGKGRTSPRIELTPARSQWVFRVFRELVKRQGQYAAGTLPTNEYRDPRP